MPVILVVTKFFDILALGACVGGRTAGLLFSPPHLEFQPAESAGKGCLAAFQKG